MGVLMWLCSLVLNFLFFLWMDRLPRDLVLPVALLLAALLVMSFDVSDRKYPQDGQR